DHPLWLARVRPARAMGQCAPYFHCGSSFVQDVRSCEGGFHSVTKQHLEAALARFNEVGATSAQSTLKGGEAWNHAFSIAAALLRGLYSHIPRVVRSVEFAEGADCKPHFSKLPTRGKDCLATLCVKLSQKEVYGEIATRSRIGAYLRLHGEVIFAVLRPPRDLSVAPLVLEVTGFDFTTLPESIKLRQHLKQVLGAEYSRKSATAYYEKHKDELIPLKDSKLRRILASVFEMNSLMSVGIPDWAVGRALWGMLHIWSRAYESFEFWDEGRNGIRVTVACNTSTDPDDQECFQNNRDLFQFQMSTPGDRAFGERFFKSGYNIGFLSFGRMLGLPGANPQVIAKLFSAANTWGPGRSGWQSYDDTWLCTDRKDHLGNVVEEQGRTIWITPGANRIPSTPKQREREDLVSSEVVRADTEVVPAKTWLLPTLLLLALTCLLMSLISSFSRLASA
ncbi:unnamed protein product, partial [Durusdinium trenchii]